MYLAGTPGKSSVIRICILFISKRKKTQDHTGPLYNIKQFYEPGERAVSGDRCPSQCSLFALLPSLGQHRHRNWEIRDERDSSADTRDTARPVNDMNIVVYHASVNCSRLA